MQQNGGRQWKLSYNHFPRTEYGNYQISYLNADGKVGRYKGRLIAQSSNQKYGIYYDENFCPLIKFESFQTLIVLADKHKLKLYQPDVVTAFWNGELK